MIRQPVVAEAVAMRVTVELTASALVWESGIGARPARIITNALSQIGQVTKYTVEKIEDEKGIGKRCAVCAWLHDYSFTQILDGKGAVISLRGRLPGIVRVVHQAHEKGFSELSTKNEDLVGACGGYHNPCKAFDDLKRRSDYKQLFDTSRRGFISLRRAVGINRKPARNDSPSATG